MKNTNQLLFILIMFITTNVGFTEMKKSAIPRHAVTGIDSVKEMRAVRSVAKRYAASHILGTGPDQYVVSVHLFSATEARVILGQRDEQSDDQNAYTLKMFKGKKGWKIFYVEYIFSPTGKKQIDTLQPPYPGGR